MKLFIEDVAVINTYITFFFLKCQIYDSDKDSLPEILLTNPDSKRNDKDDGGDNDGDIYGACPEEESAAEALSTGGTLFALILESAGRDGGEEEANEKVKEVLEGTTTPGILFMDFDGLNAKAKAESLKKEFSEDSQNKNTEMDVEVGNPNEHHKDMVRDLLESREK